MIRLEAALVGVPEDRLTGAAVGRLVRLARDMDALGRIDVGNGEPLVDEHTLLALLRSSVERTTADRLIAELGALPSSAFRLAQRRGGPVEEAPWFGLASRVTIYDGSPAVTFAELTLDGPPGIERVKGAVRARFPSLEDELVDPAGIPPRLVALLADGARSQLCATLAALARQLGWWAAVAAVLMIPLATISEANLWPLAMFLFATAIGGWTLTVVGSCLLAPVD